MTVTVNERIVKVNQFGHTKMSNVVTNYHLCKNIDIINGYFTFDYPDNKKLGKLSNVKIKIDNDIHISVYY